MRKKLKIALIPTLGESLVLSKGNLLESFKRAAKIYCNNRTKTDFNVGPPAFYSTAGNNNSLL